MAGRAGLVAALFFVTALSGCAGLFGQESTAQVVRTVRFTFDESSITAAEDVESPEAFLAAVSTTFFTYTHVGASVASDGVRVVFTDTRGDLVEHRLSDFTELAEIGDGDRVTITGVIAYSSLHITGQGLDLRRGGVDAAWFTQAGVPMPLAVDEGARAKWQLSSLGSGSLSFSELHAEYDEEWSERSCGFEQGSNGYEYICTQQQHTQSTVLDATDAIVEHSVEMDGTISVTGGPKGADPRVDLAMDGRFDVASMADVFLHIIETMDGEVEEVEAPFGYEAQLFAEGDSLLRMKSDDAREVQRLGTEGSFSTGGWLQVWDDEHPKSSPRDMFRDGDFPNETVRYQEEDVSTREREDDETISRMLDLWGMDLAPGDRFEFILDVAEEGISVDLQLDVVVAAQETVQVPAGDIDSYRIQSSLHLSLDADQVGHHNIELQDLTHWVHASTYIPVRMEADASDLIDDTELERLFQDAVLFAADAEGAVVQWPDDLDLNTSFTGSLELVELSGEVRMPAILAAMMMWSPLAGFMPLLFFSAFADLGDSYETMPSMSFSKDEAADRLTVISADAGMDWSEIRVSLRGECDATLHTDDDSRPVEDIASTSYEPVRAGHRLSFDGTGTCAVSIIWIPANAMVGSFRFSL